MRLTQIAFGSDFLTLYNRWTILKNPFIKYLLIMPFLIFITLAIILFIALSMPTPSVSDLPQVMQTR